MRVSISLGMKYHELISINFLWVKPSLVGQPDGIPTFFIICFYKAKVGIISNNGEVMNWGKLVPFYPCLIIGLAIEKKT